MKLDFESAEAGTPLESISIPALNRVGLARYAGAVDDFGARSSARAQALANRLVRSIAAT